MRSIHVRFTLAVFVVQLAVRLALIVTYPDNYSMDAYQRWGGRHHLLVQDWLPATQSVLWITALFDGSIATMRIAMAIIGALAITAGAWVARALGGPAAGWAFVPLSLFGPFLTWSVVPYQEGTFLLALFGGLAMALHARAEHRPTRDSLWLAADIALGLLPLVRYEGWPVTVLYILWRRTPRAGLALWGAAFWLLCKAAGVEGHAASPVSYADWEGMDTRFDVSNVTRTLSRMWTQALDTKGVFVIPLGLAAWEYLRRMKRPGTWLLGLIFAGQIAALIGWLIGLETATYRMQAIPGVLAGLFIAGGCGAIWVRFKQLYVRVPMGVLLASAGVLFVQQGFDNARRSTRSVRWEKRLVETMQDCPDCSYLITPRTGIGTRDRHDGCEIIQGLGTDLHGERFWCMRWGSVPEDYSATHAARWRKGGYVVRDARQSDRGTVPQR